MGSSELEILHTHNNCTTTQCKQTLAHVKSPFDSLYYVCVQCIFSLPPYPLLMYLSLGSCTCVSPQIISYTLDRC